MKLVQNIRRVVKLLQLFQQECRRFHELTITNLVTKLLVRKLLGRCSRTPCITEQLDFMLNTFGKCDNAVTGNRGVKSNRGINSRLHFLQPFRAIVTCSNRSSSQVSKLQIGMSCNEGGIGNRISDQGHPLQWPEKYREKLQATDKLRGTTIQLSKGSPNGKSGAKYKQLIIAKSAEDLYKKYN